MPDTFTMRVPCPRCRATEGHINTRNGQDCVLCHQCGRFCYNAPKTETGRETRNHRTRPDIKPNQRTRILDRDNATCVLCHTTTRDLDIGHLISVDEGRAHGLSDAELFDDENLATMCGPCNSGYGATSANPRLLAAILIARKRRQTPPTTPQLELDLP